MYSKEPSRWDSSLEHPKHMLNLMGKKVFTIICSKILFISIKYEHTCTIHYKNQQLSWPNFQSAWSNKFFISHKKITCKFHDPPTKANSASNFKSLWNSRLTQMNTNDIIAKWRGSVFFLPKFFSNLRINCYCRAYLNLRCYHVHLNLPLTSLSRSIIM